MHHDDTPIGRILSRREILALFGTTGAAILAGCTVPPTGSTGPSAAATATNTEAAAPDAAAVGPDLPNCVASPAQSEGPYFADLQLARSDIRTDTATGTVKEGVPLALTFTVSAVSSESCTPLEGAIVEIWHCDARGVYSAFAAEGTPGQNFLRGYQTTDADGTVQFTTIYPGGYRGRTVHIHFKVRTPGTDGAEYEFTSQMYFDDAISDAVLAQAQYGGSGGQRTTNAMDGLYRNGGDELMLALTESGDGYAGAYHIGLDLPA